MIRLLRLSLPLAGLVFLGGCGPTQNFAKLPIKQGPSVKAPDYADGDWWIFRTKGSGSPRESRVTYKNGKFESDHPTLLNSMLWMSVHLKDSKKKWLNFPLVPGKKWAFIVRHTSSTTGRTDMHAVEAVVVGPTPQPVKTASGTYEVTEIGAADLIRGVVREFTYFYSSKTKSVAKMTAEMDHPTRGHRQYEAELIKYSVR